TLKEKEGLALPTVRYGVEGTTVALDESIKALRDSINYILKLSELETTIYRLVDELKNTQRLINALEYIIIPRYRKELEFIESVLEELAREEFARQKIYKRRRERGD
ncbi:MAG: V-type ATP synthase subunit D, partial [Thermoprotei archaeon]